MARREIPAQRIVICDRCKREASMREAVPFGCHAALEVKVAAVGHDGGTGGATLTRDLCGRCYGDFERFMNGGGVVTDG